MKMSKEFKTGIVAVIIIGIFIWGFNFLKGQNLFEGKSRSFFIEYDNIQGLNEASLVTINGLQVGHVTNITFNSDPAKKGKLIVEISLENDFEFSKKSIAKIYSASLLGGQSLAIIPSYEGELAISGDYLKGEVESDIFSSVGEKLNPLQAKLENVIVSADSLFQGVNEVLNKKTRESLHRSVTGLEYTISGFRKTLRSVNQLLDSSKTSVDVTLKNTERLTANMSKISDTLLNANLGATIQKMELTLTNVNALMDSLQKGKGTIGKLMTDDQLYTNLTKASKEMEELLREMKLNPKRFVHFSLFGKKAKPYSEENNKKNKSNR